MGKKQQTGEKFHAPVPSAPNLCSTCVGMTLLHSSSRLLSYIRQAKLLKYNGLLPVRVFNPIEDPFEGQLKTQLKG
jgi:hypothetical protein